MKANWKKRMMDMAWHVSTWSKDSSTKVGCVITDEENTIKSLGYNGNPRGLNDEIKERNERPLKYKYVVHAEINAIANATRNGVSLKDSIMYCTYFPCNECAKAIINSGIKKLVTYEPDFANVIWGESFRVSYEMLKECGVVVEYFSDEHDEFYKDFKEMLATHSNGIIEWDYNIPENWCPNALQSQWNQTLTAKINQASAKIYQMSMSGSANKFRVSPYVFDIISMLEYFNFSTMAFGNKYHVIIDNNMPTDEIVVYNDGINGYYTPTEDEGENGLAAKGKKDCYMLIKIKNYE